MQEVISKCQLQRRKKISTILALVVLLYSVSICQSQTPDDVGHAYVPKEGFVPNRQTAIKVAEAVLMPIYGVKEVQGNKPFSVKLEKGVWIVSGTILPRSSSPLRIEISKKTGCILRVTAGE